MNLPTVLGVIGGLLGLAGASAAALVYFRMAMAKTTIDLYREDNVALRHRVDTLESERDDSRTQVHELKGKVSALIEERAVLRDLATGHSAVDALGEVVAAHHQEAMGLLRKLTDDRRTS